MRLIGLAVILVLCLACAPSSSEAQAIPKTNRVGHLHPADGGTVRAWEKELGKLGYVEGRNLIIERRYAGGQTERLPALAAELVRAKVDVIVATAGDSIVAAKNATSTIPIVMAYGPAPVERGYVKSLARPGGNVTGVAYAAEGVLIPKRFELLTQAVPAARQIGMLDDGTDSFQRGLKEAEIVARGLDLRLLAVDARRGRYEQAFAELKARQADVLYAGGSPVHTQDRQQLLALAARYRLPAIWEWRAHAEAGGLMSYGANNLALEVRVAAYVDRLLKGANPAELPVEQPTVFELVVNKRTAKALGLTIPQSLLLRADQVIE
jgi:putative tryptophan/tyrosine transport system substrate-binding protein